LRDCVEHMPVFQPALSDDGRNTPYHEVMRKIPSISGPPSLHSVDMNGMNNNNVRSFDEHYNKTFGAGNGHTFNNHHAGEKKEDKEMKEDKQEKEVKTELDDLITRTHTEHGSIADITHTNSMHAMTHTKSMHVNHTAMATNGNNKTPKILPLAPAQPGMLASRSHGLLPSLSAPLAHNAHNRFKHAFPRDIYHRDHYGGHHHQHSAHSLRSIESSESSGSDELRCDTIYGDEDEHHRKISANLDDLNEEEYEEDDECEVFLKPDREDGLLKQDHDDTKVEIDDDKITPIKRSLTWSKLNIFKHGDGSGKHKKQKKRKKHRKKEKPAALRRPTVKLEDDDKDINEDEGVDVIEWFTNSFKKWKKEIVMKYAHLFIENGCSSMEDITLINNEQDLVDIGIDLKFHRLQILKLVNEFKASFNITMLFQQRNYRM